MSPLAAIMADEGQPAARARALARYLAGKLEAGNLRRLPQSELCDLRCVVFGLDALAERLETPPPVPRRSWWRFWR